MKQMNRNQVSDDKLKKRKLELQPEEFLLSNQQLEEIELQEKEVIAIKKKETKRNSFKKLLLVLFVFTFVYTITRG